MRISDKPYFTRVTLLGVAMYVFTALLFLVPILILNPSDIIIVLILAVPALIVGALVAFIRPWGLVAGLLGGLLGLLFFGPAAAISLSSPQAFFDFASTIIGLVGSALMIIGAGVGLVQYLRGQTRMAGTRNWNTALSGVIGIVAVLLLISAGITVAGIGGASAADEQGATIVTSKNTQFDVEAINASANATTKIVLKNQDAILHTLTIDELDLDVKVGPGDGKLIQLRPLAPGTYEYYCRVFGHEEAMRGILTVR